MELFDHLCTQLTTYGQFPGKAAVLCWPGFTAVTRGDGAVKDVFAATYFQRHSLVMSNRSKKSKERELCLCQSLYSAYQALSTNPGGSRHAFLQVLQAGHGALPLVLASGITLVSLLSLYAQSACRWCWPAAPCRSLHPKIRSAIPSRA